MNAEPDTADAYSQEVSHLFWQGADRESLRVLNRDLRSAFNAMQQDKPLNDRQKAAMRELPSWAELIEAIREGVEWYNNRPHSELPMKPNGRHYSPASSEKTPGRRRHRIEWLSDLELRDMFRPMVERPVRRCEIQWLNNIYYAPELRDEHGRKVLTVMTFMTPSELRYVARTAALSVRRYGTAINAQPSCQCGISQTAAAY